jgi:hypothetical protein
MGLWVTMGIPSAQQFKRCFTPCLHPKASNKTHMFHEKKWNNHLSIFDNFWATAC